MQEVRENEIGIEPNGTFLLIDLEIQLLDG